MPPSPVSPTTACAPTDHPSRPQTPDAPVIAPATCTSVAVHVAPPQDASIGQQVLTHPLGALRRARQLSALWRKLDHDDGPSSIMLKQPPACVVNIQRTQQNMERLMHMMPAKDIALYFGERQLCLARGSITDAPVTAIVTAANAKLVGGGGVDHVVHRAAGPALLQACKDIGGCETGSAVITPAFELEKQGVQYVIHAVGPVWRGGHHNEEALLHTAYIEALKLADTHGCASVALPAISCGVYHFPVQQAARIALETVATYLKTADGALTQVVFVLFEDAVFEAFADTVVSMSP